jgi:uncharacterized protein
MKVVLDTNVLIDAFKDEYSYEKRIIDEIINGQLEAFANHQTIRENKLLLRQVIDNPDYSQELNNFFAQVNNVVNRRQIHAVSDPEDNKILESAVEAQADYLITRDRDLLNIGTFQGIKVVTPSDFWVNYYDESGGDFWKKWSSFINTK